MNLRIKDIKNQRFLGSFRNQRFQKDFWFTKKFEIFCVPEKRSFSKHIENTGDFQWLKENLLLKK